MSELYHIRLAREILGVQTIVRSKREGQLSVSEPSEPKELLEVASQASLKVLFSLTCEMLAMFQKASCRVAIEQFKSAGVVEQIGHDTPSTSSKTPSRVTQTSF
jgi:hypothetical protein